MLYKRLAEKTEIPLVKSLLLHIAYDSQKLGRFLMEYVVVLRNQK